MVGIGIISYNPNLKTIKHNLDICVNENVDIVIIDNNSNNINQLLELVSKYKNVNCIKNEYNKGVATALNQIMRYFEKLHLDWVLTFDQDSIISSNLISTLYNYKNIELAGVISPRIKYISNIEENNIYKSDIEEIEWCITSGSLTNMKAWKDVGGFDENLFIDFVDTDFCYRIKAKEYKIYRVNYIELNHQLGNLKIINFFGKKIRVMNHNSSRKYYYTRNSIICFKKNSNDYPKGKMIRTIFLLSIKTILFEKDKVNKIKMIIKGIRDGIYYQL